MNLNTQPSRTGTQLLRDAEKTQAYQEELAILDFTEEVLARMAAMGLSKAGLAQRLDVDPAHVSKLIGGSNNFTLRTMVKISRALETELRFHLQARDAGTRWIEYDSRTVSQLTVPADEVVIHHSFHPVDVLPRRTLIETHESPALATGTI
jgi:plasmid maintenance system antidote protein VapI